MESKDKLEEQIMKLEQKIEILNASMDLLMCHLGIKKTCNRPKAMKEMASKSCVNDEGKEKKLQHISSKKQQSRSGLQSFCVLCNSFML